MFRETKVSDLSLVTLLEPDDFSLVEWRLTFKKIIDIPLQFWIYALLKLC